VNGLQVQLLYPSDMMNKNRDERHVLSQKKLRFFCQGGLTADKVAFLPAKASPRRPILAR
jgi:hypothetical protein